MRAMDRRLAYAYDRSRGRTSFHMLQGLMDLAMTLPAATLVFVAAGFVFHHLEQVAAAAGGAAPRQPRGAKVSSASGVSGE